MLKDILLSSGRRIEVMGKGEKTKIIESEMSPFHKITLALPIWLNSETIEGLTAVPGIGLKTAGNIVFERAKKGGFKRLEDLRSVKGIGPVMYDKIRLYLAL
jgi:competence protein ComEA